MHFYFKRRKKNQLVDNVKPLFARSFFFPWYLQFQIVCKDNFKYEVNSPDTGVLPLERPVQPKNLCGDNYIVADRLFLILSPILFLIFNVIYWFSYCSNYIFEVWYVSCNLHWFRANTVDKIYVLCSTHVQYSCILRFNYEMMSMNYRNFLDQLEKWGQIKNELFWT